MMLDRNQVTTTEVLAWQGLHLLHAQPSTCSQKVRLMLGELELEWQSHPVNLMRHENHTPWFLGINPRGVVPVLVHDGVVHIESNDIIRYLDERFAGPDNSYFFPDGSARAAEAQALLDMEDALHNDLRLLTIRFGPLSLKNDAQIKKLETNGQYDEKRAQEVRWWRDKLEHGIGDGETRAAVTRYRDTFVALEERLQDGPWLMGERISIVDLSWYVNLQRLARIGYPLSRHARLFELFRRLSARPASRADAAHAGSRAAAFAFGLVRIKNRLAGTALSRYL